MINSFCKKLAIILSIICLEKSAFAAHNQVVGGFIDIDKSDKKWASAATTITTEPKEDIFGFSEPTQLPAVYDVRSYLNNKPNAETEKWPILWPVQQQGSMQSCVSNALTSLMAFNHLVKYKEILDFSRLFIYYNGRMLKGSANINSDTGLSVTKGVQSINVYGVCHEKYWPYAQENLTKSPSNTAYELAASYVGDPRYADSDGDLKLDRVFAAKVNKNLDDIKYTLHELHKPIAFGLYLKDANAFINNTGTPATETIGKAKAGYLDMRTIPTRDEPFVKKNGHCMVLVAYNDETQMFTVRNSFGPEWGRYGYCFIPYSYVLSAWTGDEYFWTIGE